ncbi:MAG TPA: SRPBCC family protein [Candidatus Latescibacteria bacterium]|nr:SRPBCC family protein [Candidatus Latescibacterota bacterium]
MRLEGRITIGAPADDVFSVVSNISFWPKIFEGLITDISEVTPTGAGVQVIWTYKVMGIKLKGKAILEETSPKRRLRVRIEAISEFLWTLNLKQHKDSTDLLSVLEYDVPRKGLGKLLARWTEGGQVEAQMERVLANIKRLMEER